MRKSRSQPPSANPRALSPPAQTRSSSTHSAPQHHHTTPVPQPFKLGEYTAGPPKSAMRPASSVSRLWSRASSCTYAPRATSTPVRRIHQEISHSRRPQSALSQPQAFLPQLCRHAFSSNTKRSDSAPANPNGDTAATAQQQEIPQYQMTFTCKVCTTRSSHKISKQGYHHGTVLISCPGCKNRHLIADHLRVCCHHSVYSWTTTTDKPDPDLLRQKHNP